MLAGASLRLALTDRLVGDVSMLELRLGGRRPFALLQALAAGTWGLDDVQAVIAAALPVGAPVGQVSGRHALLASKLVEAHLFGLPVAEARFDESAA